MVVYQEATMDKEVLKRRLTERFQQSLDSALQAVDEAADGQWIAASEWEVRDIFQQLTSDCFGQMIQRRIDQLPSASQAAFSPDAGSRRVAEQGKSSGAGAHRRRRD
jgi:hypothetical protein